MKKLFAFLIFTLVVCSAPAIFYGQNKQASARTGKTRIQDYAPAVFESSAALQSLVNRAAAETIAKFAGKGFKSDNLAVTLVDLRAPQNLKMAHFNGDVKIYPASVVKMFYLAALHQWLEEGKIKETPELKRGMKDMIVDSSNDATGYVVDVLTGTSGGAELSAKELKIYADRREAINRYFGSLKYTNINVNQKTYCEDLYGRERQFWDAGKNRNKLTTNAQARLLTEIVLGKAVTGERSRQMMDLMKRRITGAVKDPDDQSHGFTGIALQKVDGAQLWSKAGWTSTARHDAAYVETPGGLKFVIVVFTTDFAAERNIIPNIAEVVLNNLGAVK